MESSYRAKIILLKDNGYTVPQIRKMTTNHHDHDANTRKWNTSTVSMKKVLKVSYPESTYTKPIKISYLIIWIWRKRLSR